MRALPRGLALRLLAAVFIATVATALMAGRVHAQSDGTDGGGDTTLLVLLWSGIAVFVLVEAGFVLALVRFRARGEERSGVLLTGGTLVLPVVAVVALFGASAWAVLDDGESEPADPMTVRVHAFQFQWEFTYDLDDLGHDDPVGKQGEVVVSGTLQEWPTLVLPLGEPVELQMTSNDVLHSMHIPGIANKLDIAVGRERTFVVTANEAGSFIGQCAELCGVGHLEMRFTVEVMERDQFNDWIRERAGSGAR